MDDIFSYLIIIVCIVWVIILMKKWKDSSWPNSRYWNFRNIFLFVVLWIAVQFISSSSYAFNISELNISWDWVRAFWQAYWNLNNNSVSTCSWNSDCNLSYQLLYDDMCYIWAWNWKYYTPTSSEYYTVINTSACQSPTTIWGYYYWSSSRDPWAEFSILLDYWNYYMFVPWVSFTNNWEGIDFGYIRGSQWKVVYSVPSRAWFVVEYWDNTYTMTKVFVYPNRFIFSTSDGSFMFEVGAGWTVANWFFVIDPSAVSNNLYFVDSVQQKARSTTINSDLARDLLLWNTAYWTVFSGWNFWNIFDTSYTLTTVAWGSIFPSGFGPWYQDSTFWFSYQEDLDFIAPSVGSWNDSGGAWDWGWSSWGPEEVQESLSLLDAIQWVLDARWERICKSTNGALLYQNDFEQYLWTYAKYKSNCENNVYAPTPYDNWTWSQRSLKALWSWIQSWFYSLVWDTNNENVCAYADYLSWRVNAFVNSIDCSTCKLQYLSALQYDYWSGVITNGCINASFLLESVKEVHEEVLSWTIHDPTNDNVNKMASKLLDTFKVPFMSGYNSIITPTCYYWQNYQRANYLLYGIFALYIFILFKLLH